jgi:hypothetical protein
MKHLILPCPAIVSRHPGKKIFSFFLCLLVSAFTAVRSQNVLVSGAVTGNGSYPDLTSAFTAINSGSQSGASITVSVVASYTEPTTAMLSQGAWANLVISPVGNVTVSGNIAGPLIDLNGADRVGINGINSGGNTLTIDNQSTGTTGTCTIRFINDARSNLVANCTILGASASTTLGTIFFSTGTVAGNDSNVVSFNQVGNSSAGAPANALYSSGTAGMENSDNTISSNNIYDYFNAGLTTAGILVEANNNAWTISSNRLFQTALRTYTTSNTHKGIRISSGSGHTVTNNTIGFSSAAGTGTYAMAGTVATRFIGIDLAVGTASASSVQGNTITAFSLGTSSGAATTNGIWCGINITSGNVNVGNAGANTIGGSAGANLVACIPTATQGAVVGINTSSTGTILIQNNIIGGLSSSGSTAAVAGSVFGINISGTATSITVSGNTIGNTTADNMRAGTSGLTTGNSLAAGINMSASPVSVLVSGNTIQNFSSYGTGTSGYVRGFFTATSTSLTSTSNITGNTIRNLVTNNTATGISSGLTGAEGIHFLSGVNSNISGNTIFNIANTNTGTGNYIVAGIVMAASVVTTTQGNNVFNNTIYGLSNAGTGTTSTSPPIVAGIALRSGNATTTLYNNMISLGNGQSTNTAFVGIWGNHGSTPDPIVNMYHNTINIEGVAASGALSSFGYYRGDFSGTVRTQTIQFRNNIVTNTRSGGTGFHFALGNNFGATVSATGWAANASNTNVLNANASTVGWWGGNQTFAGWQAASAGDGFSYSGITVTYVNPVSDLHLNFGVTPTAIESGGQTLGITTDIDGQTRPGPSGSVNGGATAPDIGADEFDGVPLDLLSPTITYTALTFTCATSDRTFTASISDLSGVPVTGVLQPRVYFRKNAGPWFSSQGVLTSGNANNGTWTFTIVSASMGGVTQGDVISYFVIAQDVAATPNVTSNPAAGLVASDVNTVTTPPSSPNSYPISSTLSGTYTVGVTGTYPTLTAAVNAYNTSCLGGAIIFSLVDATYPSETFPITVNANPYANATNTLTIKTMVPNTVISGSSATAMFVLNGADYVTIDGSVSSTANTICPRSTASRDLTIANTNASATSGVIALQTTAGGDAATNNALMNCIISGNSNTTTLIGINMGGPTIGSGAGANGNNNNRIINNLVQKCQFGIFSAGASVALKSINNDYLLNDMNGSGANAMGRGGLMLLFEDSPDVMGNTVANILNSASVDVFGLSMGLNSVSNTTTTGSEVSNANVSYNKVDNIVQTNTFSAMGIMMGANQTGINTVSNNFISNIFSNGTVSDFASGLFYAGGAGIFHAYHNSITVTGNLTGATQPNIGIGINGTTPQVDIRDNIVVCSGSNGVNGNTAIGLGYSSTTGNYLNLVSNNNDFFVSGTGSVIGRTGSLSAGTTRVTLTDWQNETGRDNLSVNVNPVFISASDLHLNASSNNSISNTGAPIAGITSDIDCDTRSASVPDIGADEFCAVFSVSIAGVTTICSGNSTLLTASGAAAYSWSTGATTAVINVSPTSTTTYSVYGTDNSGVCTVTQTQLVTVNPLPNVTVTGNTTICSGDSSLLTANGASTYVWSTAETTSAIYAAATASTTYTVTGTDANGCSNTATYALTVNPLPSVTVSGNTAICSGDSTLLTASGASTYVWNTAETTSSIYAAPTTATIYTVTGTDANGCSNTATYAVTVNALPNVTVTGNTAICSGDSTLLTASGASTYVWNTAETTSSIYAAPTTATTYTVTGTDANGCSNTATYAVSVNALPTVTVSGNAVVCFGDSTLLTANGALTYVWNTAQTTSSIYAAPTATTTYTVTGTDGNGCSNSAAYGITVNPLPAVTYTETQTSACVNWPAFTLTPGSPANGTYSGTAVTGNTFDPAAAGSGTFAIVYTFTDVNGCTNSDTSMITVGLCTGISGIATDDLFALYPNSTEGWVTVQVTDPGKTQVEVMDVSGRVVQSLSTAEAVIRMDLSGLANGMYLLRVSQAGRYSAKRIIIQK